ncbi:MAG: hypothetical protein GXX91_10515 [Verrucomicrobiaceae bacterium]|nr:hypothetical protein [Verrucomicrobiaceae bacterium]
MKTTGRFCKRHWGGLVVIVLLAVGIWYLVRHHEGEIDREAILAYGMSLPPLLLVAAFFVLPLAGFPVSVLLVVIGLRFGIVWGMVIVAVGMFFHLLVVHGIARSGMREKMLRRIAAFGYEIPAIKESHRLWFTTLFASIHGPPYAAKLYLLALTNLPFRYHCGIALPVYIGFSLLPVSAGKAVLNLHPVAVSAIVLAALALLLLGRWLARRHTGTNDLPGDGM